MARTISCDGCGKHITGKVEQVGVVLKGDYCEPCSLVAEGLVATIDKLHERVAADFKGGMNEILAEFQASHPGFVVPDYRHVS